MKLKCFVACAFGFTDVDAIYDSVIDPVARELDIQLLRVDRIEHNLDIDDKILLLMDESDLCIADLTYARPSVYFEAGYMEGRGKPVVFTCRSDHFPDHIRFNLEDSSDNLRVNFDLQWKGWI